MPPCPSNVATSRKLSRPQSLTAWPSFLVAMAFRSGEKRMRSNVAIQQRKQLRLLPPFTGPETLPKRQIISSRIVPRRELYKGGAWLCRPAQ